MYQLQMINLQRNMAAGYLFFNRNKQEMTDGVLTGNLIQANAHLPYRQRVFMGILKYAVPLFSTGGIRPARTLT